MLGRPAVLSVVCVLSAGCPKPCENNYDCDDGLFCNGVETCVDSKCSQPPPPDCSDGVACTNDRCSEELRRCVSAAPDEDGDGFATASCLDLAGVPLGEDCDDTDERRFPGNLELCDARDDDCDLQTIGRLDADRDGYISSTCSNPLPDGGVNAGPDCDDGNEGVHPGQLEACNGSDDNCDGESDEGVLMPRYVDADHDGYGAGAPMMGCFEDVGTSAVGGDCDDTNPAMRPGQFRCVTGGQGIEYDLCQLDGGFMRGNCPGQQCRPQPNGTGFCL